MAGNTEGKLSRRIKLLYGVGDIGNATINSAVQFFLMKFYTDAALVLPALAGNALLIGKFWDAINDPLFGWVSDRTRSRFGKRRVFMLFGAIPLGISVALLWYIPPGISRLLTFIWIAFTFILFDTLWTLTNVPYYSLTSELTDDYDERSSLTTYRMVMAVPAYLVGAAVTPLIVGLFALQRTGFAFIGILYGAICAVALLVAAIGIRERRKVIENRAAASPWQSLRQAFSNIPFVRLCAAYFVINLAFAFIKTLMAYFLEYQLLMKNEVSLAMGLMLVCVTIAIPVWKRLSEKMNKGPAYAIGMALGALAVAITFFLPNQPTGWVYLVSILAGFGFAAQWIFPWSMVADVADEDRLKTGEYRSGVYYGVWGLATKISEALALAGVGWMLTGFGYVPNVAQSAFSLLGIRLFFGPIPMVLILVALPLLIWYPLTRQRHGEIQRQLAGMDAIGSNPDQVG